MSNPIFKRKAHHAGLAALLAFFALLCFGSNAQAQVRVGITSKEKVYILHEPIIVTIGINNMAGRDIFLSDEPNRPWLVLELSNAEGRSIPARDAMYRAEPLLIKAGDTVKRQIDITPMFSWDRLGEHRLKVSIYLASEGRYFSSNELRFDIAEGRLIWQEIVGIPDGQPGAGQRRHFALYTHRMLDRQLLYARVSDPDSGVIYGMRKLGRTTTFTPMPTTEFDSKNQLFILHLAAPRTYLLSGVNTDGERFITDTYEEGETRPKLGKSEGGRVNVTGGKRVTDLGTLPGGSNIPPNLPRASDRPSGIP